ncbi:hypothetical protein [Frigoriglobus tundricola]|uniref:Uncharacterized protein n=1 Tax=Frigoriglobus tundricola TaxID=2774151 RepID=A0A6M5YQD8_9BACT|nr:hypothetical protein [Frigoriglobus tundricola]QJW96215.1 hypothetical protein FTUN_3772 [Frigoriglobus tundricola]
MLRACVTCAALVVVGAAASAAPPAVSPDPKSLVVAPEDVTKARDLVQKLGSETYLDREHAEHELAAMGRLARVALLDGANLDPDPEVRARCRCLLPRATAEETKARLDAFLADTDGKYDHDLPGWQKLRSTVRGEWKMFGWTFAARPTLDKAARALFIEFFEAPGGRQLLAALSGPPQDLAQLVATRRTDLYNARFPRVGGVTSHNPSVAEVGVVLFAESLAPVPSGPRVMPITSVLTISGIPALVRGSDDRAVAMRAVMSGWFDSRTDPVDMYQAMTLATTMQNDDAAGRLAARMMAAAGTPGVYKGQALVTLVRLKAVDRVPMIEKAFTDTTALPTNKVVNGMVVRDSIEVRDAALAAALVMTGQDPDDYGFEGFPKGTGQGGLFPYNLAKLPEAKRKGAFEKWKAWREKNP